MLNGVAVFAAATVYKADQDQRWEIYTDPSRGQLIRLVIRQEHELMILFMVQKRI